MDENEARIEVKLAERVGDNKNVRVLSTVTVIDCKKSEFSKNTLRLRVLRTIAGGLAEVDLAINSLCASIFEITVFDQDYPTGFSSEYSLEETEQWAACCDLLSLFKNYDIVTGEEKKPVSNEGPTRLEVTLQDLQYPIYQPVEVLATNVLLPIAASPDYVLQGKVIIGSTLGNNIVKYSSYNHYIKKISTISGDSRGIVTRTYSKEEMEETWKRLEEQWSMLTSEQTGLIRGWEGKKDTHIDSGRHHKGHWTGGGYNFKPEKAYFRCSGDDEGAVLLKDQKKRGLIQGVLLTPQQSRESILNKEEAGEVEKKPKAVVTNLKGVGPIEVFPQIPAPQGRCSRCGGFACEVGECRVSGSWPSLAEGLQKEKTTIH